VSESSLTLVTFSGMCLNAAVDDRLQFSRQFVSLTNGRNQNGCL